MEKIDILLEEWSQTEDDFNTIKTKRDNLEKQIISIMMDNIWRDYHTKSGIHASINEEEESHVDLRQLSLLLTKTDLDSVTRHTSRRNLIIMTPNGKKRLRKMLKV